jgi:hypothetical protein
LTTREKSDMVLYALQTFVRNANVSRRGVDRVDIELNPPLATTHNTKGVDVWINR